MHKSSNVIINNVELRSGNGKMVGGTTCDVPKCPSLQTKERQTHPDGGAGVSICVLNPERSLTSKIFVNA